MAPLPRTLLLTRPREQSLAFATALERVLPGRFQALVAPMLAIAPTGAPIALDGIQALLFTSANGVAQFAAQSPERGLPALCVGAMTTEAARRAGFAATSAEGDVAALARLARDAWRPGGTFLHVRGRHAAGDLVAALGAWGVPARAAEIYDQVPQPLDDAARAALGAGAVDALAVFSPRSASLLGAALREGGWPLAHVRAAALSAAADAGLGSVPLAARAIAASPTRDGLIAALAAL
ncbi:MAG: uroporphyrinogen-III synthase [Amaricoccus sp.]